LAPGGARAAGASGAGRGRRLPAPAAAAEHGPFAAVPAAVGRLDLPGYEVLEEIGRGGMGVVYRARQAKLNRLVALKGIRAGALAGAEEVARFRAEAEVLASLQHPNVVQVFDVGEHAGHPFFAMELVSGGSLRDRLAGAPLPTARAARLLLVLA